MPVLTEQSDSESFSNLTPDQILDAVETTGIRCDGRLLALNSYENRVYQVGLEESNPLVVKFYRPERWSDDAILEEHRFTLALAEQEIPVVPPILDNHESSLYRCGPYRFALYPCRGGRAPELDNPEHLEQLGRLLGRIHAVGACRNFEHRPTLDIDSFAIAPSNYLLEHDFLPDYLKDVYANLIENLIEQIQRCYEQTPDIRYLRLHGDFHLGNVLWRDNGPHIVDFDDARMGPAVQDIWMFLSGDRVYMTARLGDLLEGYTQFFDFNPSELKLIEALRTLRIVRYAGWLGYRWTDPAFPIAFPWFNTTRYWDEHILSLREQSALMNEAPLVWD